jgi:hypothetical protein
MTLLTWISDRLLDLLPRSLRRGREDEASMDPLAVGLVAHLGDAARAAPGPSAAFLASLEAQLNAAYDEHRHHDDRHGLYAVPHWLRDRGRRRFALGASGVAAGVIVVTGVFFLDVGPRQPSLETLPPLEALAASYEALESVETVRYQMESVVTPSQCYAMVGEPLSRQPLDGRAAPRTGIVLFCSEGADVRRETGEVDFADRSVRSTTHASVVPEGPFASPPASGDTQHVLYVGNTLYTKSDRDALWRASDRVASLSVQLLGVGGGRFPGVEALKRWRPGIERLPDETLDGVRVLRYRASVGEVSTGYLETVEVWVGADDGLIRRVINESREALSPPDIAAQAVLPPPDHPFAGDAAALGSAGRVALANIEVRPSVPTERRTRTVYTFYDFDEPLDIRPPAADQVHWQTAGYGLQSRFLEWRRIDRFQPTPHPYWDN